MNILPFAKNSAALCPFRSRSALSPIRAAIGLTAFVLVAASPLLAQNTQGAAEDARRRKGGDAATGDRRSQTPEDFQARMLESLRERLDVTDDEEWKLISERLKKLTELRRSAGGGGGFGGPGGGPGRGGPPGGGGGTDTTGRGNRTAGGGRGPGGGSPEMTALSNAVRDKLPDAEIKSRLDRVRELRRDNEMKLAKAQEEFRAVLSVRQEAVVVVFGLLP